MLHHAQRGLHSVLSVLSPVPWFHPDRVNSALSWHGKRQTTAALPLQVWFSCQNGRADQTDSRLLMRIYSSAQKFCIIFERGLSYVCVCECYISAIRASSCFYQPLQKGLLFSHLGNSWPQISLIFTHALKHAEEKKKDDSGTFEQEKIWPWMKKKNTQRDFCSGNHSNPINMWRKQKSPKTVMSMSAETMRCFFECKYTTYHKAYMLDCTFQCELIFNPLKVTAKAREPAHSC